MPKNLYGPHENFNLKTSHVIAALMRRTLEAKKAHAEYVEVWGNGTPRKLLDLSRMTSLGWKTSTPLKEGLALTYERFVANEDGLPK